MARYLNFLFSPNGRISRKDLWLKYLLVYVLVTFVAVFVDNIIGFDSLEDSGPFESIVSLFFLWPGIAVLIKRFHDRGMTGWWVLILTVIAIVGVIMMFVPIFSQPDIMEQVEQGSFEAFVGAFGAIGWIGVLLIVGVGLFSFVVNYCLAGEVGPNEYGPDPLDPDGGILDDFN